MSTASPRNIVAYTHQQLLAGSPEVHPTCGLVHLTALTNAFRDYFQGKGYQIEPPVRITEQLDSTVRFIGAPISVLKPYFMESRIPEPGIAMVQNCIRTRNLKSLLNIEDTPKYGSFFTGLCSLVPYSNLARLCKDTVGFLQSELQLSADEIRININHDDEDLYASIRETLPEHCFNFDSMQPQYYRHRYGIAGVRGRNFNLALRRVGTDTFEDIGNIIVIENTDEMLGVELALGDTTILQQLFGLNHILDCYNLPDTGVTHGSALHRKLEDVMITCLALYREGLRPSGKTTQARILRSYMKALSCYRQLAKIELDHLGLILKDIEQHKLPFKSRAKHDEIVLWIEDFENGVYTSADSNEDILLNKLLQQGYHG